MRLPLHISGGFDLNNRRVLTLTFIIFFLFSSIAAAEEKEIIIKMKENVQFNAFSTNSSTQTEDLFEIIKVKEEDLQGKLEALREDPRIEYIEEEIIFHYTNTVNDLYFNNQKKDFSILQVVEAWKQSNPVEKTVIAVLDSGVNVNHPDLRNRIVKPHNVLDSSASPTDNVGHGTHVAGIAGAQTNNNLGVASIAQNVSVMPIKVGDLNGATNSNIVKGIQYAVKNGASIINLSLGSYDYSEAVHDAIKSAVAQGVLIIAAAGNDGESAKMYPAAYPEVLAVGAVDSQTEQLAGFSNYGDWVNVTAPGVDLYSTCVKGAVEPFDECKTSNPYMHSSGTSMAAPMVASLAALLKSEAPSLSNKQNRYIIEQTSNLNSRDTELYQYGIVNAKSAIDLLQNENRLSGKTSVATSIALAQYGWLGVEKSQLAPKESELNKALLKKEGKFAILASNQSFPDSLAASTLAAQLDAPIYLTFPNRLDGETITELKGNGITDVIVLGGTVTLTDSIVTSLEAKGFNPIRLRGENRYATAVALNDYVAKKKGEVIIASGQDFPDALAISAYAALMDLPIVFVENDKIPAETAQFLEKYQFSRSYVIGGTAAISEELLKELPNPTRISGADRYETTIAIHEYFKEQYNEIQGYFFTTGRNFPDALAGGILSARTDMPILLVDPKRLPQPVKSYLEESGASDRSDLIFRIIGGKAAVSTDVKWQIDQIFYDQYYQDLESFSYNSNSKANE
jgi:cell wall-associated protease